MHDVVVCVARDDDVSKLCVTSSMIVNDVNGAW